ncbi:serine/threonine-protein kinase [Dactylosporangium sp. NPDC005572]|uniref:serine/threonine-protein kinase n=1 Tax=Dactylosporangium sp. NPDC005572 TaxID=3156889 RepID=UPI0033A5DD47
MPPAPEIPGYQNLTLIGRGARSTVYHGQQRRPNRDVAIKVLHVDAAEQAGTGYERELETTVLLSGSHPHLVRILDTGVTDAGLPYVVMEHSSAGSYARILETDGPLPVEAVIEVGEAIADALQTAHDAGLVHGAVKPSNILSVAFNPALADFPVARAWSDPTAEHQDPTAVHHLAPEVLDGDGYSPAADLYGLASTMWYLLTGRPPSELEHAPLVPRPDVPSWLQLELDRALRRNAAERHPDAGMFAAILRHRAGGGTPVSPAPIGLRHHVAPPEAGDPASGIDTPSEILTRSPGLDDPTQEGRVVHHWTSAAPIDDLDAGAPVWPDSGTPGHDVPAHAEVLGFPIPPRTTGPLGSYPRPEPAYEFETTDEPRGGDAYDAGFSPFADGSDWPEPRRPRRVWMISAGVAAVVALCAAGAYAVLGGDRQTQSPSPKAAPQTRPPDGVLPSGAGALRSTTEGAPGDVKLVDEGVAITLSWTDPTAGAVQFAVLGGPRGAAVTVQKVLEPGTTKLTMQGLNTAQDYCYQVWAVVDGETYAPSQQVCTKRA